MSANPSVNPSADPQEKKHPRSIWDMNLIDDYLFTATLSSKEFGEDFARTLLRIIFGRTPEQVQVHSQKYLHRSSPEHKAIQLDVMIEEEPGSSAPDEAMVSADPSALVGNVYDVEAETQDRQKKSDPLPKRMRFYHSRMDNIDLKKGKHYSQLRNVFVIVISNFDPFDRDRFLYTIKNSCVEEPDLVYNDGAATLFLNTTGTVGDVSQALKDLLGFIEHSDEAHAVNDDLRRLMSELDTLRRDTQFEGTVMHSYELEQMFRQEGRQQGRDEEHENTLREMARADAAEERADSAEAKISILELQLADLQKQLQALRKR